MNSGLPNSGRYRGYFGAVESLEVIQQTSGVILAALRVMGEALLCGTEDMDELGSDGARRFCGGCREQKMLRKMARAYLKGFGR
jgi:hypothetical protein